MPLIFSTTDLAPKRCDISHVLFIAPIGVCGVLTIIFLKRTRAFHHGQSVLVRDPLARRA